MFGQTDGCSKALANKRGVTSVVIQLESKIIFLSNNSNSNFINPMKCWIYSILYIILRYYIEFLSC